MFHLESACLLAEVAPHLGGSLLRLDWKGPDGPVPILLPCADDPARPTERAMFVMLPWCNRIGGEGLVWQGQTYPMPVLVEGQALPIHGTGLHRRLQVIEATPTRLRLSLREAGPPPFNFEAALDYALGDTSLSVRLAVTHRGPAPAPYGIGFHPWFVCGPRDRLSFRAGMWVEEDAERLPLRLVTIGTDTGDDFSTPRMLPDRLINATHLDWKGPALLDREDGMRVHLHATGAVSRALHVFARSAEAGFVCLEPVSHTVDCTNRPMRRDMGLAVLTQNETLEGEIRITSVANALK